jgi:hypothetical protein
VFIFDSVNGRRHKPDVGASKVIPCWRKFSGIGIDNESFDPSIFLKKFLDKLPVKAPNRIVVRVFERCLHPAWLPQQSKVQGQEPWRCPDFLMF